MWVSGSLPVQATPSLTRGGAGGHLVKKMPKNFNNYASVECGAKILGANPEAKVGWTEGGVVVD